LEYRSHFRIDPATTEVQGLGNVVGSNSFFIIEIGQSSSQPQDPIVAASRKTDTVDRSGQQESAFRIGRRHGSQGGSRQPRVAGRSRGAGAAALSSPRRHHPLPNGARSFAGGR